MTSTSHSFAEILNRQYADLSGSRRNVSKSPHRQRALAGSPRRADWDQSKSSHSPTRSSQDAARSATPQAQQNQKQFIRSSEQLTTFTRRTEKRTSDISVITQVRVSTPSSQDTAIRSTSGRGSGRTTPRPPTPTRGCAQEKDLDSEVSFSPKQGSNKMQPRDPANLNALGIEKTRSTKTFRDDRSLSRRDMQTEATVRAQNKLADMFGSQIHDLDISAPTTNVQYVESYEDMSANRRLSRTPVASSKSPMRSHPPQNSWQKPRAGHVRNSNSIDRKTHNNSVASSAHLTESENATASSDVFSQDEAEEAYESDISSLGDDEASDDEDQWKNKAARHFVSKPVSGRLAAISADRGVQHLPAAPTTSTLHDMLSTRVASGITSVDFASQTQPPSIPAISPASSVRRSSVISADHSTDLSRRPPSPALSDISDAESFDSAIPPPISMTRDSAQPRYRSAADQRQGIFRSKTPKQISTANKSSPNLGLSKSNPWTAAGKTSFAASADARSPMSPKSRTGSVTPSRSRTASRADSLPTPGFSSSSRPMRSASLSVEQPSTHTKTFNVSLPSFSNIFSGFSLKNKTKKEVPKHLPPLRKITFDTRGKKQIVDLNVSNDEGLDANEIAEREVFGDRLGDLTEPSVNTLKERKHSVDTRRSVSSQGANGATVTEGRSSQQGWRNREKGAPRRTAWR